MLVKSKLACQPRFDFRDHRAIVTGGSRGIGRAIADALGEAGAQVYAFDVGEPEHIESFPHQFVRIDIADTNAVKAAIAEFPQPPTLLVNNAGITRDRSIAKMSDADWAAVLNVNLTGAFNMIRAVAPLMAAQGFGRIVNITSINGLRGKFGQANYAAAKAGLIGLTKTAAREFGKKGVTVNAVAPGMVMTDMARALPEEILASGRGRSGAARTCRSAGHRQCGAVPAVRRRARHHRRSAARRRRAIYLTSRTMRSSAPAHHAQHEAALAVAALRFHDLVAPAALFEFRIEQDRLPSKWPTRRHRLRRFRSCCRMVAIGSGGSRPRRSTCTPSARAPHRGIRPPVGRDRGGGCTARLRSGARL